MIFDSLSRRAFPELGDERNPVWSRLLHASVVLLALTGGAIAQVPPPRVSDRSRRDASSAWRRLSAHRDRPAGCPSRPRSRSLVQRRRS